MTEVLRRDAADELRKSMQGEVITPQDEAYEDARKVWNGTIDRRPAAIARCVGNEDVAAAVAFGRRHSPPIAVRAWCAAPSSQPIPGTAWLPQGVLSVTRESPG